MASATGSSVPRLPRDWQASSDLTSPESRRLLAQCREVLAEQGLSAGRCLSATCEHGATCWADAAVVPPDPVQPRLPWVGPGYRPGGVVVVGMNARTHAGLDDEAFIVEATLRELGAGRRRFFGDRPSAPSWFHYRAAVAAGLLDDAAQGRVPTIRTPEEVGPALFRSARLQAVQCAPADSARRTPTAGMWRRCPSAVAWPTLAILRPGAIALLGTQVRAAFSRAHDVRWEGSAEFLRWGTAEVGGGSASVFALRHPSSGYGMRSLEGLRDVLSATSV